MTKFKFTTWKLVLLSALLVTVLAANGTLSSVADRLFSRTVHAQEEKPDDPPKEETPPIESRPPVEVQEFVEDRREKRAESDFDIEGNENGITWGKATIKDSNDGGFIQYSVAQVGKTGYLYGDYQDSRFQKAEFASMTEKSTCGDGYPGYEGFDSLSELKDVSTLEYKTAKSILIGGKSSDCYQKLLVVRQPIPNEEGKYLYLVLDPLEVRGTSLKVRWWAYTDDGTPDFSKAPANF